MTLFAWILYFFVIGLAHAKTNRHFQSYPTTVQTFENDTVLLPCYVENQSAQTKVEWWRDSNLLADSGDPGVQSPERITLYSNGSLRVLHVQREDSGEYVCQATRPPPWGSVTQVHEIEVMYPPSVETVPASGELEVNLGEQVEMQCLVKGVPDPIISWRTKDKELPLLENRPQLRLHADDRHLAGRYTCVASNKVGDPAEAHIDLRIRYKPEIYVRKPWVHAHPEVPVQLTCTVTAWPEAEVEWYFKNETVKINARKHRKGDDHTLLLRDVKPTNYGSYVCRASNTMGVTEKSVEVSGIANPAVFKKESRNSSATSYYFIWEVDSYSPIIEYQFWFRKYRKGGSGDWHKLYIPSGSDARSPVHVRSFNLTGLNPATHYEAVVLSRNRYGWGYPSEILRFHTDGAPALDSGENLETDVDQEQNNVAVIAVSMSQQYPLASGANESTCRADVLMLSMLSTLVCVYSFNYKTFGNRF
ncbi:limbic system-associated membrane protein-like [Pseudomyrmex gracilis]|uniref:limbic system-associated membrane protein-like n=1 Tax=Pseudomyrmex gracilis TaxID=219809 RepID=UPI0009955AFD|nr:limbic system-associated membrane protein-like [Pseudomyrmex gracilis]